MESVNDLITAADTLGAQKAANSTGGILSSLFNAAYTGYTQGRQLAVQDKNQVLEQSLKQLQIEKTRNDLKSEAQNRIITGNLAKRLGLMDLTPDETTTARTVAFDNLGGGTPPPTDHSAHGKMAGYAASLNTPYNIIKPKFSMKEGLGFDFEKPEKPKDSQTENLRVMELATQAAKREKYNLASSVLPPDEALKISSVEPSIDHAEKFVPELTAYQNGDKAAQKKMAAARKAAGGPILDSIKGLQSLVNNEKNKHFWQPSNTELTTNAVDSRNKLIDGKSLNDIADTLDQKVSDLSTNYDDGQAANLQQEIGVYLNSLSRNPGANRDLINRFKQQKVQLMTLGGKK